MNGCVGGIASCGTILPSIVQLECDEGYAKQPGTCVPHAQPVKVAGTCDVSGLVSSGGAPGLATPNPIQLLRGAKTLNVMDFQTSDGRMSLRRDHSSMPYDADNTGTALAANSLGTNWHSIFDMSLSLSDFWPNSTYVTVLAPNGQHSRFVRNSSGMIEDLNAGAPSYFNHNVRVEFLGMAPNFTGAGPAISMPSKRQSHVGARQMKTAMPGLWNPASTKMQILWLSQSHQPALQPT